MARNQTTRGIPTAST
uniref:Uncharacterized protein n=1 Tax=Arundo donax TaxID=35708 RepID=A0A0A9BM47_ARUDO